MAQSKANLIKTEHTHTQTHSKQNLGIFQSTEMLMVFEIKASVCKQPKGIMGHKRCRERHRERERD